MQAGTLDGGEGMGLEDVRLGAELWVQNRVGWLAEQKGTGQCQEFK